MGSGIDLRGVRRGSVSLVPLLLFNPESLLCTLVESASARTRTDPFLAPSLVLCSPLSGPAALCGCLRQFNTVWLFIVSCELASFILAALSLNLLNVKIVFSLCI